MSKNDRPLGSRLRTPQDSDEDEIIDEKPPRRQERPASPPIRPSARVSNVMNRAICDTTPAEVGLPPQPSNWTVPGEFVHSNRNGAPGPPASPGSPASPGPSARPESSAYDLPGEILEMAVQTTSEAVLQRSVAMIRKRTLQAEMEMGEAKHAAIQRERRELNMASEIKSAASRKADLAGLATINARNEFEEEKLEAMRREQEAYMADDAKRVEMFEAEIKFTQEFRLQNLATLKAEIALEVKKEARSKKQGEELARAAEAERKAIKKLHLQKMSNLKAALQAQRQAANIEKKAETEAHEARMAAIKAEKELSEERKRAAQSKLQAAKNPRAQNPQPPVQTQAAPAQAPRAAVRSNQSAQASSAPRSCSHCKTSRTGIWRNQNTPNLLCNACYVYRRLKNKDRPVPAAAAQ